MFTRQEYECRNHVGSYRSWSASSAVAAVGLHHGLANKTHRVTEEFLDCMAAMYIIEIDRLS